MSEPNKGTDQQNETMKRTTASRARDSADKATAPVSDAAKKTEAKAGEVASAAQQATGQVTSAARTAWTALAHRKMLAMGVGAGVTAVSAASYAVGRRAGRRP